MKAEPDVQPAEADLSAASTPAAPPESAPAAESQGPQPPPGPQPTLVVASATNLSGVGRANF